MKTIKRVLVILGFSMFSGLALGAPLAPDDPTIGDNLVSWVRDAGRNYKDGVWTANKGPNMEAVGDAGDGDFYEIPVLSTWTPEDGFFAGNVENATGVLFSADESDLLRAMGLNGGDGFDELTLIGVYQTEGNTDRTRPVGIGSRTEDVGVLGNAFNLSADASLRYDNGNNRTDPGLHLSDLTYRAGILFDGLVTDILDGDIITEEEIPGGSFAGVTRNDDLYIGDVRGGLLDTFAGVDPVDIFVAEVIVYNAPLSELQISGIGEWLLANLATEGSGDRCDFDENGTLDVADIDLLGNAIQSGATDSSFDITGDGLVDVDDLVSLIESTDKFNSFIGDSNLDGQFNSTDFVVVFQAGQYEDAVDGNSTWATGDWTGDGDFNSSDLVLAFQRGGFEQGPRQAHAVPEPASIALLLVGIGLSGARSRRILRRFRSENRVLSL